MKIVINQRYEFLRPFIEALPEVFDTMGGIIYKGRNILKRYDVDGLSLVVKSFKKPHLINRFVYTSIRPSKASRSYHVAEELLKRGVVTPEPIAYIEERNFGLKRSFYVTRETLWKREMREFWHIPEIGDREFILRAFGIFTGEMHKKNVLHLDYSPGNILFDVIDGLPYFTVVDVNRVRFGKITEEEGYKNFERLWLPNHTFVIIAKAYADYMGYDTHTAIERICYYKDCFMKGRI